jgi:hypothetical protein
MRPRRLREAVAATLLAATSCGGRPDPLPAFPRVMLWAWERPERLGFIDPARAGVAFLARSISWRAGQVTSRPRFQPLEVPPGTRVMAVMRLDSFAPPLPDVNAIADEILTAAALPRVGAVQIDFDARASEREWYAALLRRLHERLPSGIPLTITALASWCLGDRWIASLPVADAVPMLFRMGAGEPREVRDFRLDVCRSSLGISTDEVPFALPHGRRLFVFDPRPWTPEAYRAAIELSRRWR